MHLDRYLYLQTSSPVRGWLGLLLASNSVQGRGLDNTVKVSFLTSNSVSPLSHRHPLLEPPPKIWELWEGRRTRCWRSYFVRQRCMRERHFGASAGRSRSLDQKVIPVGASTSSTPFLFHGCDIRTPCRFGAIIKTDRHAVPDLTSLQGQQFRASRRDRRRSKYELGTLGTLEVKKRPTRP
jgi:hypothetical protein